MSSECGYLGQDLQLGLSDFPVQTLLIVAGESCFACDFTLCDSEQDRL